MRTLPLPLPLPLALPLPLTSPAASARAQAARAERLAASVDALRGGALVRAGARISLRPVAMRCGVGPLVVVVVATMLAFV